MLFKKNKDKILYNLDGIPVFDKKKREFLLPFSERQQNLIVYIMDHGLSIAPIAYTDMKPELVSAVYEVIIERSNYCNRNLGTPIDDLSIWKILHTKLTIEQARWCTYALLFGGSIVDNVSNPGQFCDDMFRAMASYISIGKMDWSKIYSGMDQEAYISECICYCFKYGEIYSAKEANNKTFLGL